MSIITGQVTDGVLTVPSGVTTSHWLCAHIFVPQSQLPNDGSAEPSDVRAYSLNRDSWVFPTAGAFYTKQYEPFQHDGRASYTWTGPDTVVNYAFVKFTTYARPGSQDEVDFAWSYPTGGGITTGALTERDPMVWGYTIASSEVLASLSSAYLVGYWASNDYASETVDLGILVEPLTTEAEFPLLPYYLRVTNTLPWPGNNTSPIQYDWTTTGAIGLIERTPPPLRQNQRDDIRQGQRTSRQLTVRQVGYL